MSTVLTCSNIKARFSQPSLNYIAPARILFHLNIVTLYDFMYNCHYRQFRIFENN